MASNAASSSSTAAATNPCESIDRDRPPHPTQRQTLVLGRDGAALDRLEAERQFRKIIGYRGLATLIVAIERDHDRRHDTDTARTTTKEAAIVAAI